MNEDEFIKYIEYNKETGKININISEYKYPKSEFDVNTELDECISTINWLYNQCDDDRITYDDQANTEYYTREAIQGVPQRELTILQNCLNQATDSERELKLKHQIEILKYVVNEINDILS